MTEGSAPPAPWRIVLMGVAGSGKSTIGQALAARLGARFLEGDAFHPAANIHKMAAGEPLTDEDRWPWPAALRQAMRGEGPRGCRLFGAETRLSRRPALGGRRPLRRTCGRRCGSTPPVGAAARDTSWDLH